MRSSNRMFLEYTDSWKKYLIEELQIRGEFARAVREAEMIMETKLADLNVRRETFGYED